MRRWLLQLLVEESPPLLSVVGARHPSAIHAAVRSRRGWHRMSGAADDDRDANEVRVLCVMCVCV